MNTSQKFALRAALSAHLEYVLLILVEMILPPKKHWPHINTAVPVFVRKFQTKQIHII